MLNADDQGTFRSIRELKLVVQESKRPLIFWVGAGASKWLGYPLWCEVASNLRREFFKFVAGFDNTEALELIKTRSFPRFFQRCWDLDRARYNRFLSNAFLPRPETPLYRRFTDALGKITPTRILTTNVDEALEQRFPTVGVFQRSDFSGCIEPLQTGKSFIAKLHGSRSSIGSTIFTDEDYEELRADATYISTLRTIFALGTVVFLGYGVTDQYVIDLLSDNARDMSLFGAGPHFVVSSDFKGTAPFRTINYSLRRFADHRAALTVIDLICQIEARKAELSTRAEGSNGHPVARPVPLGAKSAYFISDFMPPGTWNNSITAQFAPRSGVTAEMTVGLGFTHDEVPFRESTAPQDLVVGLACFDVVYFPLSALYKVLVLLGDILWQLVQADVIRFIHLRHEPAIISVDGALMGDVGLVSIPTRPLQGGLLRCEPVGEMPVVLALLVRTLKAAIRAGDQKSAARVLA
jgi:SIR2-like domain